MRDTQRLDGVDIVAAPGLRIDSALQPGDVLIRVPPGEPGLARTFLVETGDLRSPSDFVTSGIEVEGALPGRYVAVRERARSGWQQRVVARRIADGTARTLAGNVIVRAIPAETRWPPFDEADAAVTRTPDTEIESLGLKETAKDAAYALRAMYPQLEFTSGLRSRSQQASAMAGNVATNRSWIDATYAYAKRSELQAWVDAHPEKTSRQDIAAGLATVLNTWSDADIARLSLHTVGRAFDVQPVTEKADEIKQFIQTLPGITKFLDKEGGKTIWHAEF